MPRGAPRILLSAGEPSGDRLGAGLARALAARSPGIDLVGMGGERMADAGVRLLQDSREVAVVGLIEVLAHLPAIRAAMRRLERALDELAPDLVVPIDFPDFNLRLAARAASRRIPVVYYVGPQVWAWRRGRLATIRRRVRRMLVLFPFETRIYEQAGVPVSFVGYPVTPPAAPSDAAELRARLGIAPGAEVVALLPGSRPGEVGRQLPPMLDAAERLAAARAGMRFVLPAAPGLERGWVAGLVAGRGPIDVVGPADFGAALAAAAAGVVAAGTATLDAALAGLPIVVVYRMSPLTHALGRLLAEPPHVALPSVIAGRRLVPELIQGRFTGEAVACEVTGYLEHPARAEQVRRDFDGVRESLDRGDAFGAAAEAVLRELASGEP